jgi:glucose-6-phosphate 1-epimerase
MIGGFPRLFGSWGLGYDAWMPPSTTADLRSRFAHCAFFANIEEGAGGLPSIRVATPVARGLVYLHGGHVAEFQPAGERPVLFMSQKSSFEPAKPIRGGVPVIFPWFGPNSADPGNPMHGFARTSEWELKSIGHSGDEVAVELSLSDGKSYELGYTARFGRELRLELRVRNLGSALMRFEEALHTYFAVSDVRRISITGLEDTTFIDKTDGAKRKEQGQKAIRFAGETDRVYLNTRSTCTIDDPEWKRRVVVEKDGSNTTVVWNPWVAKAKAMADFGDQEWLGMVCIESANVGENAITLESGAKHEMKVLIGVRGMD